jgi:hypothetical protein
LEVPSVETAPATHEFVSDQYDDAINEEEIKRDMMQLKLDKGGLVEYAEDP